MFICGEIVSSSVKEESQKPVTPPKSEALFLLSHQVAAFVYADVSRTTGSSSVTELREVWRAQNVKSAAKQTKMLKTQTKQLLFFHSARAKEQINIETNHFSLCVKGLEPLTPQSVNTELFFVPIMGFSNFSSFQVRGFS